MLMLFLFCAPMHAQTPTFKSTSSYRIANPNYSAQQLDPTTIGHEAYRSTIYTPFGSSTPSSNNNPGGNNDSGSGTDDDDVGIPGWADTPSEPLPIGDTAPLFLFAATMIAIIFIKQRRKQIKTQSINTSNNNDNSDSMHTTRHISSNRLQKLFLLLAFVCFVGQVSADKTIYFRPSTTQFKAGWNGTSKENKYLDVYWTKGTSNFFPIELRTDEKNYESIWTDFSNLVEASNITGYYPQNNTTPPTPKSRFIEITVPDGYNYIVAYRAVWSDIKDGVTKESAYTAWKDGHGEATTNVLNQNTIPTKNPDNGDRPNEPALIPTDGRNLLACREGWWDNWYWAYYLPNSNDVRAYFANLYDWPNLQLLFGKDIYSIASWYFEHIENTKLYQRTLNYKNFEVGYEQYGFISNPDDKKFSTSHQIDPCKYNTRQHNDADDKYFNGTVPGAGTLVYIDANKVSTTYNEVQAVAANMIANRIKTADKYTALQANLLSGSELFIPESGENGTAASKSHLTNDWKDLNHTLTIKNYIYNPQTKSYDNSNTGGYVTYYTHKLTGATTTQRIPEGDGTITVDANSGSTTAAYTAKTVLQAYPKEGYKFHGWYDKDGTLLHDKAEFTWYKVQNYDNEVHARFLPKNVKHFKYRVQTCASGQKFNTDDFDATGGSITVTATDGQSVTISKANGNDNEYQRLYHQDDTQITCTATPNSGYVFVGWWNNKNGQILTNPWIAYAGNMNDLVTARFASVDNVTTQTINVSGSGSATITRYLDHASSQSVTTTQSVTVNAWKGTSVTLVAEADQGHTFLGWYDGQNLVSKELTYTYTATEARNITAYFAEGTGTTTLQVRAMEWDGSTLVKSDEGGTFTLTHSGGVVYAYQEQASDYDKVLVSHGSSVTFQATINNEYEFIGWFNVTSDRRFFDNPWVMEDPSKVGYEDKTKETYVDRFTAVFAHQDYANKQTIKIEGPGTVTANYTYYDTSTREITIEQNSSFIAWAGKQVTLTAEALAGYEFDGWYEGGNKINTGVDGNTLTYTATTARTITAKFKSAVNKLTVSVLNYDTKYNEFREYEYEYNKVALTGGGKNLESYSSFSCEFDDATTVTLTATPETSNPENVETDYHFIGWYQNNTLLSKEETINVNVIGMQAISAHFAPKQCYKVIVKASVGGIYMVKYAREDLFDQEGMYYIAHSQHDKDIEIFVPYDAKIEVINPQPIHGYSYLGFKVFKGTKDENKDIYTIKNYNPNDIPQTFANFVRTDEQVVYLDISNRDVDGSKWNNITNIKCNFRSLFFNGVDAGDRVFTELSNTLYSVTIPAEAFEYITIDRNITGSTPSTGPLAIPSTRYNCFKLNAYQSSTGEWVDAWTTVDTEEGDYRLIYREQTVVDKNTIRVDYEFNEGDRIKKITSGTKTDIVNLHIYNKVSSDGINGINNPEVILQQWDGTAWADVERYMVFGPLRSDKPGVIKMPNRKNTASETIVVDKGIAPIIAATNDEDQACGVWNFYIKQENGTAKLEVGKTEKYTGNYYIRTTNADGQYHRYTIPANVMQYSEYAKKNSDYSHYFIRYVDINEDGTPTTEAGKHNQVKFTVATDYAIFLCKELMINNNRFSEDEYENDIFVINDNNNPKLPADATVRFGWDIKTNRLTRAYIANTTIKNNEYLVVEGTNIGSPQGDDTYFTDNSNWLYTIDLNATKNADTEVKAKVKAKMNGQYQYFMGSQDEYATLISGNGANTYPIRLLYDFKDDRFTTIYRPSNTDISGTVTLETPVMIERKHNEAPTQIKFANNAKFVVNGNFDKPAYAVMTFLESVLADASKTHHEKMFYWISFPFDVKISDVFGLGDYGKYWIMEEYNGAQRAASGLAQNNWKYITKKSAILEANKGYVLCLNYSQILQDKLFKSYGSSDQELNSGKLSLYFPSNSVISPEDITGGQDRTVTLARYENNNTAWNHHNWHIIGVPSFANPEGVDFQYDIPFVYQYWHPSDAYAAKAYDEITFTFQAMHAYMVQYHGDITWQNIVNTGNGSVTPMGLAAKTDEQADKKVMLRLELQQADSTIDKTYVQLRNDKGTKGFDMSLDLTKIINAGANIYSIVDNHEMAGNAIPKEETVLPLGVVITAAGEYTFAMPNGTEGMIVELIDYEQGTCTNLLVGDYTVNMPKGTNNTRFALRLKPDKVATSVEDITSGTNDNNVRKLLIDGVLYLQQGTNTYDAQGKHVQ